MSVFTGRSFVAFSKGMLSVQRHFTSVRGLGTKEQALQAMFFSVFALLLLPQVSRECHNQGMHIQHKLSPYGAYLRYLSCGAVQNTLPHLLYILGKALLSMSDGLRTEKGLKFLYEVPRHSHRSGIASCCYHA